MPVWSDEASFCESGEYMLCFLFFVFFVCVWVILTWGFRVYALSLLKTRLALSALLFKWSFTTTQSRFQK